jgi:Flp pilus assembly protein CpaB
VVTLLVGPAEAEALTLSNNEGKIQLVLRNSTDRQTAATRGRQLRDLYGVPAPVEAAPATVERHAPGPSRVRAEAHRTVAAEPAAAPESEMILIHGNVKKIEVFPRERK